MISLSDLPRTVRVFDADKFDFVDKKVEYRRNTDGSHAWRFPLHQDRGYTKKTDGTYKWVSAARRCVQATSGTVDFSEVSAAMSRLDFGA